MIAIAYLLGTLAAGALVGLIPYFVCRYMQKPELGQLALIVCTISMLLMVGWIAAIGFTIAAFTTSGDIHIRNRPNRQDSTVYGGTVGSSYTTGAGPARMEIHCLSGPLKGQVYTAGTAGCTIGRSSGCQIRFPDNTPGISRNHCAVRWNGRSALLVDMNSTYGTYLPGGFRLSPSQPTPLNSGDRFLLSQTGYLFQVFIR